MKSILVPVLITATCGVGCAKVAPKAGKAFAEGEKAALKTAPAAERAGGWAAAERAGGRALPAAERDVGATARRWAERVERAVDLYQKAQEAYAILCEILNNPPAENLGTYPRPASEVQPIPDRRIVIDPQSGGFALANNVGGFSFYTPNGEPLGFCAYNSALGEMHFFSFRGVRIG